MANFYTVFAAGQEGLSRGLPTGIPPLTRAINGIQKAQSIGLAAAPKTGKTTLADFGFVIMPYLYMLKEGRLDDINWIYASYEIDRISKEFKFAAFFMYHDYGVYDFEYEGHKYLMSEDYLRGKQIKIDTEDQIVLMTSEHKQMLKNVYETRIIPLFGEYDEYSRKLSNGKIDLIEQKENPTGLYKYLMKYAADNGEFVKESYTVLGDNNIPEKRSRIIGYKEKNPNLFTIVVTDHVRKFRRERGFTMKENIDKWLEYSTEIRNLCYFTFINIVHSGRQLSNVDRMKFMGESIYPTADDTKDTGNIAEESNILLTMLNPNDEKYNLEKHMGVLLKDYPLYRSIHIADARSVDHPVHIQTNMYGNVNYFEPIK